MVSHSNALLLKFLNPLVGMKYHMEIFNHDESKDGLDGPDVNQALELSKSPSKKHGIEVFALTNYLRLQELDVEFTKIGNILIRADGITCVKPPTEFLRSSIRLWSNSFLGLINKVEYYFNDKKNY